MCRYVAYRKEKRYNEIVKNSQKEGGSVWIQRQKKQAHGW